jgi:hypothetical protein
MSEKPLDMKAVAGVLKPAIEILEDALADIDRQKTAVLNTINLIRQRAKVETRG